MRTRPSATRCASSSGATRWRACAPSPCTRSAPPAPSKGRRSTPRSRPTPACRSTRRACTRRSPPGSARAGRRLRTSSSGAPACAPWRRSPAASRPSPTCWPPAVSRRPCSTPTRRTGRWPISTPRSAWRSRARGCASGSTCRSPEPALSSPAPCRWTSCSATSHCSSTLRGRSSWRATSPAPSATSCAWCATATASSSSSATRARRSAPRTGCAT